MSKTFYTKEKLVNAVKNSYSISQSLKKLGLDASGNNYQIFKKRINNFNIDTSHFTGQGHLKGKTHNWAKTKPLKEILIENSYYNSHRLKLRS